MDTETCLNAANALLAKDYAPAVVEYMDTDIVEFSGNVTGDPVFPVEMDGECVGATLMLTLEGEDDDSVMEKMEEIAELAEEIECLDILVGDTPTMKREVWAAHDAFHTSMESGAKNAIDLAAGEKLKDHIGNVLAALSSGTHYTPHGAQIVFFPARKVVQAFDQYRRQYI